MPANCNMKIALKKKILPVPNNFKSGFYYMRLTQLVNTQLKMIIMYLPD